MLSEFSDFFRTPYVDQHAKEVPKNIVFWGAPFHWHVKAFKDTVCGLFFLSYYDFFTTLKN